MIGESQDAHDRRQSQICRLVNQYDWDYKEALRRCEPFTSLDSSLLTTIFSRLEPVSFSAGTPVAQQGQPCQSLCFIVSGQMAVHVDRETIGVISSGDHFGAEVLHATIRRFQRGAKDSRLFGGSQSAASLTANTVCECLILRTQNIGLDVLQSIAAQPGNTSGGNGPTAEPTLASLKAQRDDLLLKVQRAKLLAMREQLEGKVREQQARGSTSELEPQGKTTRRHSEHIVSSRIQPECEEKERADEEGEEVEGEQGGERQGLQQEKARLEEQLQMLLQQELNKSPPQDPPNAAPPARPGPLGSMRSKSEVKSTLHPFLRGVIPIPLQAQRNDSDLHCDRNKWGAVWASSYYFYHDVYRQNVPKAAIPVDTNGNGIVDSLAVDFTGDGRVDTILRDPHSERVALRRNGSRGPQ